MFERLSFFSFIFFDPQVTLGTIRDNIRNRHLIDFSRMSTYSGVLALTVIDRVNAVGGLICVGNAQWYGKYTLLFNSFGLHNNAWLTNFSNFWLQYNRPGFVKRYKFFFISAKRLISVGVILRKIISDSLLSQRCIIVGCYTKYVDYFIPFSEDYNPNEFLSMGLGVTTLVTRKIKHLRTYTTISINYQLSNGQIVTGHLSSYLISTRDFFLNSLWKYLDEPKQYIMLARYIRQYAKFGRIVQLSATAYRDKITSRMLDQYYARQAREKKR